MIDNQASLVDNDSATVTLQDGRLLGYARYGVENGPTIICLHGAPGSRIDFARSDTAAKAVGARLISVDRPGIGLSSPHQKGTLLTYANDIKDFTEILGLDRYAVLVSLHCFLCVAQLNPFFREALLADHMRWHVLMLCQPTSSKLQPLFVV